MTSAGPTVIDPPAEAEGLPRWLTLREAAFVSGIEEEELQAWVISGNVRCDRSLSRRLGDHYLLVLSEDLVAAGLLEAPAPPAPVVPAAGHPAPVEPAATLRPIPTPKPPVPARSAEPLAPADVVAITPPQDPVPADVPVTTTEAPAPPAIAPLRETAALVWTRVYPGIRQALRWVKVGLLLGLLLAASVPLAFRYRTFPVTTASMAPALRSGDLMLVRPVGAGKVRVGDVVVFRDAANARVPARVKAVESSAGMVHVETETDATRAIQRWTVPAGASIDLVRYRVSLLGRAIRRLPPAAMRWVPYGLPGVVFVVLLFVAVRMRRHRAAPVAADD